MNNLSIKFNQAQKKVVCHQAGPLLVVAGAGTGKTSVLIGRLAQLFLEKKVSLDEILLLTFTEKAAGELEERADKILPYGYFDAQIYTFHGLAEKILREFALEIGLPVNFKLINTTEQWILIKKNLDLFNLDYYRPLGNPNKFIAELLKHFSRLKDENISSQEYLDYIKKLDIDDQLELKRLKELAFAYKKYNQLLLDEAFLDFGDLIKYSLLLFKKRPNLLKLWQKRFKYIMVDEFQDTNWAQYELVKQLAHPNNNLLVVGDDDQAIYKFRGASLANIMQFKEDYPQAKEVLLTDNYRSYQEILDRAYLCIKNNNPYRLEVKLGINKELKANLKKNKDKKSLEFNLVNKADDEVVLVAEKIKNIVKKTNSNWSDIAILSRSNQVAEDFSNKLTKLGVPNQFISLRGLYRKPIILDCLAYLKVLNNYHQAAPLFRLLNLPLFNIEYKQIVEINRFARIKNLSLFEALQEVENIKNIDQKTISKAKKIIDLLKEHSQLIKTQKTSQIFLAFIKDSGLINDLDFDKDQEQFSYLNQFYKKIKSFEESLVDSKLVDFLESLDLEIEAGDSGSLSLDFIDNDVVKIMTVHAAKGLEFKNVFLVSLNERKFPSDNRQDKITLPVELIKEKIDNTKDRHIEEERRLFYVAMTRAKEFLHLSAWRGVDELREKKVSRFVLEAGFSKNKVDEQKKLINGEIIKDLSDNKRVFANSDRQLILPTKFSFSQLAAFDNCPLQYKFAFILKIPAPLNKPSLIFGRVMHTTLYEFLKPLAKGGQADLFKQTIDYKEYLSWARLKEIYKTRFVNEGYNSLKERNEYYDQGEASLKIFYGQIKNDIPKVWFLEKNFSFYLDNDIIKGTIDRIDKLADGSLAVIDYKTGSSKDKLSYKDKRQLILYQLFLEKSLKTKVSQLSYYYLQDGSSLSFQAVDKEKIKLEAEIREQIKAIKKREFLAKPSLMCNYCDFKEICPWRKI
jgi:DNA helicase II / ATP-dependent DNA helicase PcrA